MRSDSPPLRVICGVPARADSRAVLADKNIDAVALALPNELHFEFAQPRRAAGKHVYIEKPIANTMTDALAIAALERARGVRIVVGHCARLLTGMSRHPPGDRQRKARQAQPDRGQFLQ